MSCLICGNPTDKGIVFCDSCEKELEEQETADIIQHVPAEKPEKKPAKVSEKPPVEAQVEPQVEAPAKKGKPKYSIAAVLVLVAIGFVVGLWPFASDKQNSPDSSLQSEEHDDVHNGRPGDGMDPSADGTNTGMSSIIATSTPEQTLPVVLPQTNAGGASPGHTDPDTHIDGSGARPPDTDRIPPEDEPVEEPEDEKIFPYYIEAFTSRYEAFQEKNPDMPFDLVVAYTNANVDKGSYIDVEIVPDPTDINVLLNHNFALPADYEPPDLVTVNNGRLLRAEAAEHLGDLIAAGRSDGMTFVVSSGYRTKASQAATFNTLLETNSREAVERNSARPRHSEHESGLAIDVLQRSGTGPLYYYYFQNTKEYAWLNEHAYEYGFIHRYPSEYTNITRFVYEPWHWRYIGIEAATTMKNEEITTYEEYYGKYIAPYLPLTTDP